MSRPRLNGAIIVAAGGSRRMDGIDKQFALLAGQPVLARSVAAFEATPGVAVVVIVANPATLGQVGALGEAAGWRKVGAIVPGGARRQDSAARGLIALETAAAARGADLDLVLVHDGARPLAGPALITRGLDAAHLHGAAIAAIPVRDTVKVVDAAGRIQATPDRATLLAAQTPQVFRYDLLAAAYAAAEAQDLAVTDDAALLEALGQPVYVYEGDAANLKITTPDDLLLAEALLAAGRGG
jgi:2-C-methyl-D-erythritol 4-phosphate cytidylyltransferase